MRSALPTLLAFALGVTALAGHPLDALDAREIAVAAAAVRGDDRFDTDSGFAEIELEEPAKSRVLAWSPGRDLERRARVTLAGEPVLRAIVDLTTGEVVSRDRVEDVVPRLVGRERRRAEEIVRRDPRWEDAVRARGVEDPARVVCVPLFVRSGEGGSGRLVPVVCYDARDPDDYWSRPLEGLVATVDLTRGVVAEWVDARPPATGPGATDPDPGAEGSPREPLRPISMEQPEGPSFQVLGHQVSWQGWSFHVRIDARPGLVLSLVRYADAGRERPVLYRGSLSELFVPYMDPAPGWDIRAHLDGGEHGLGRFAGPLEPGVDCPGNAIYLDAVVADEEGGPVRRERAGCLFERYAGEIAWRHHEGRTGRTDVRRRVDLVVRSASSIGNYDYVFDWIFRQDGTIRVETASSGIPLVRSVGEPRARSGRHGRRVAPGSVAVHHDHFFSFRLDVDVDRPANTFVADRLESRKVRGGERSRVWVVESRPAERERDARMRIDLRRPALWRVVAEGAPQGPPGYQLRPGNNASWLLPPGDRLSRFAGFVEYHLWVTPYRVDERYAAGEYPAPGRRRGLPSWTRADRPIRDTDIVLWYTMGFHHVVRSEDWPVMPTATHGFELRPFDFFLRNPALDLPRSP